MKRKFNIFKFLIFLFVVFLIVISSLIGVFFYSIGKVSSSDEKIEFVVEKNDTFSTLGSKLKDENLIKNELAYKIYIKLKNPNGLKYGTYKLSENMGVKDIIKLLSVSVGSSDDVVSVTIPEGKHITDFAQAVSLVTNNSKEDLLDVWGSEEFLNNVIEKYWFVTDVIKNKDIKYALEGYFFPSTYELLNKDVDATYVAYKFLDQMDVVLSSYKDEIEHSKYSVHEILTLASIVEHEAVYDEDRPIIAGVFYNRLNIGMKLQSCATVGYATGTWKLEYTNTDLATVSPYNTYYITGLPVGPGNSPSQKSIEATLRPTKTDYYFFLANVCSADHTTYYAKTVKEHEANYKYIQCD